MEPRIDIRLLGGFRLAAAQQPVSAFTSKKLQSLLAYLLLHRDAPISRQQLAFLLHPDSSENQARAHLRMELTRLRRALPHAEQLLITSSETVQWHPESPYRLDVAEFEGAIGRALVHSASAATVRAELEQAVRLYRGDLLPGCYDDWILPERERLREKYLQALDRLVEQLDVERDFSGALIHAQQLLLSEPLQETTYQRLMRLHAARGDRASVLRVFHMCEDVLQSELGVDPSPETRALFETLQHAQPSLAPPSQPLKARENLPVPLTSFVGRVREITETKSLLSKTRLLTLTGVGGVGKSRLALEAAGDVRSEYPSGVWWVELASLSDASLIAEAIRAAAGISERPGHTMRETLVLAFQSQQALLIFNNCEHLVQACADLAIALLRASPGLKILATSREPLRVPGETLYVVPPLSLPKAVSPSDWQSLDESDSARLFVERAQSVLPTFALTRQNAAAVARTCRELDGLPLALELAAARVRVLSVDQIAARLVDRFNLLAAGDRAALPRHQTLRALVDWSYEGLEQEEQALLRTLSMFRGGFTLEAAEAVCVRPHVLDALSRLADKSLVVVDTEPQRENVRFRLLETIRQYANEKLLAEGEVLEVRNRHLAYFLKLAEAAKAQLGGAEQKLWLDRLDSDYDNLRAAGEWAIENDADAALRLAWALTNFWTNRGFPAEGREWMARLLPRTEAWGPSLGRIKALSIAASMATNQGDNASARVFLEQEVATAREAGDLWWTGEALWQLGNAIAFLGNPQEARPFLEESEALFQRLGDQRMKSSVLFDLAMVMSDLGDYDAARAFGEESLTFSQTLGNKLGLSHALNRFGELARSMGDYKRAGELYQEALGYARQLDVPNLLMMELSNMGFVALHDGDPPRALSLFEESLALARQQADMYQVTLCLVGLAAIKGTTGKPEEGARLFAAVDALCQSIPVQLTSADRSDYRRYLASVRGQLDAATFDSAWAKGRALTPDQAMAYALARR